MKKTMQIILVGLMILNGLLFVSNIYVINDREAAIAMHDDLAPTASALMANLKVLCCFVTGLMYITAAFGIIRNKLQLAWFGVLGFLMFDGLYLVQLYMWWEIHPRIWIDFTVFGGISLLIGLYSLSKAVKSRTVFWIPMLEKV